MPPHNCPATARNEAPIFRWGWTGAAVTFRWRACRQTFETYYSRVVVPRLRAASGTRLIAEFVRAWDDHCLLNKWMHRFFMYLVRSATRSFQPVSVTTLHAAAPATPPAGPALRQAPQCAHAARARCGSSSLRPPGPSQLPFLLTLVCVGGPSLARSTTPHRIAPGMARFHDIVFKQFAPELSERLNDEVQRARTGEVVDFDLLRQCIHVRGHRTPPPAGGAAQGPGPPSHARVPFRRCRPLQAIEGMDERAYHEYVELPLLERTKRYYRQRGTELIETESTPTFLAVAEQAVEEEEARAQLLLQPASLQPLLEGVRGSLIQSQMEALLRSEHSGLRDMLAKNRREDLRRVFRLFHAIEGGLDAVGAVIREHVEERGERHAPLPRPSPRGGCRLPHAPPPAAFAGHAIIAKRHSAISNRQTKDSASDPAFVQEVLALQSESLSVVADAMGGHPIVQVAVHKGLETVVNSVRATRP